MEQLIGLPYETVIQILGFGGAGVASAWFTLSWARSETERPKAWRWGDAKRRPQEEKEREIRAHMLGFLAFLVVIYLLLPQS